jgi:hypothetical protein
VADRICAVLDAARERGPGNVQADPHRWKTAKSERLATWPDID